jgi:hypothetical protein
VLNLWQNRALTLGDLLVPEEVHHSLEVSHGLVVGGTGVLVSWDIIVGAFPPPILAVDFLAAVNPLSPLG